MLATLFAAPRDETYQLGSSAVRQCCAAASIEVPVILRALPCLKKARAPILSKMDLDLAKRLLAALQTAGVRYSLVGSMAMAAHGLVRATRDLDLFVDSEVQNVGRLRAALQSVFDDPSIDEIRGEDLRGEYPAISYAPPSGEFTIDILARIGEAFSFSEIES